MTEDLPIAYGTATPIGWEFVTFPEVVFFQEGPGLRKYQYRESGIPFLNIRTFVDEKIDKKLCNYLDPEEVEQKYKHFLIDANDILVATSGSIGKIAIASSKDLPLMLNTSIMRFRPIDEQVLERRFLYFFLKSNHFFTQAKSAWTGTAQKNMGPSHVKTFTILLPPLNEQRRIVEKLDRIFDRLRRVRDELSHIKKLIDRYRQSVLTAAFRGDLTADWRVEKLSDSWYFDNVGNVSTKIHYGYTASSTSVDTGTKLLRITDIQNGTVDWETVPFCEITQTDELKYKLEMGDLLFARTGATVGKSFLIETEIPKAVFASYLIRIILGNNVIRKYVYYFFQSDLYWAQIRDNQIGTGQPNVNGKILSELMIPICPLEEQKEIVRRIEERFAKIEKIEQEYQKAVKLCDRLEQATLAKAFRGELVPQDPNDEPASVLLERIRAERAMLTQPRKKSPLRK